jgi:hypothetical protein
VTSMLKPFYFSKCSSPVWGLAANNLCLQSEPESGATKNPPPQISAKNMRAMLAMSVCMSANIGGTATTIGLCRED